MGRGKNSRNGKTATKGNRGNGNGNGNGNGGQFIIIGPNGICTRFDGRIKALSYYGR